MSSHLWPLQMFDPDAPYAVVDRRLPHWSQAGTVCFITWRAFDSIPTQVLTQWHADRHQWLREHGINPKGVNWQRQLRALDRPIRAEFTRQFSEQWHRYLDDGHGSRVLRKPEIAKIVGDSLHHFDGDRYELTDFCHHAQSCPFARGIRQRGRNAGSMRLMEAFHRAAD